MKIISSFNDVKLKKIYYMVGKRGKSRYNQIWVAKFSAPEEWRERLIYDDFFKYRGSWHRKAGGTGFIFGKDSVYDVYEMSRYELGKFLVGWKI